MDDGKFRTHRLIIRDVCNLKDISTWEYLYKNNADIIANNQTVKYASANGYLEVVKYLHENGADITAFGNYAVRSASKNGHLEVVKYLHENGADTAAFGSYVMKLALKNNNIEVVEYLKAHTK